MSETITRENPLLGLDGFRDNVTGNQTGPGHMNELTLAGLTHALVEESGGNQVCVVGRDPRSSGEALAQSVVAGAQHAGASVEYLGIAPTPAIFRTALVRGAGSAVSVTPSHIPEPYNGWKGTAGSDKLDDAQVEALERRYWRQVKSGLEIPPETESAEVRHDLTETYIASVVAEVEKIFGEDPLRGKKLVVDGANGAAATYTPDVMRRLGAEVTEFACDGSGAINVKCGAGDLNGVKAFLRTRPDLVEDPDFIGVVANDGDGDRIMGVGAKIGPDGQLLFEDLDGNRSLELLAKGQPGVVATEYANDGMIERLQQRGVEVALCPNGDINVTHALEEKGWPIGAEFTGHVVIREWLSSGDGVLVAGLLAAIAAKEGKSFYQLAEEMPLWPEKMFKAMLGRNNKAELKRPDVIAEIAAAEAELGDNGRFVIRPSGTEKGVYRVWGVGRDDEQIGKLVERIGNTLIFPKTFASELIPLAIEDLDEDGQDALRQIHQAGYDVQTGLREEDLPEVAEIADQDEVYKYCRRDSEERFGGVDTPQEARIEMAKKWHEKMRLFFQLRRTVGTVGLAGYGWTGPEKPGEKPTFAVRVNEEDAGKRLGTLLTRVIVSGTRMRVKTDINLETWGSNPRSRKAYLTAGAAQNGEPELARRPAGRDEQPGPDGKIEDLRYSMVFPAPTRK